MRNMEVTLTLSVDDIRAIHALADNAKVFVEGGADESFVQEYEAHIIRANRIIDKYLECLERMKKRAEKKLKQLRGQ